MNRPLACLLSACVAALTLTLVVPAAAQTEAVSKTDQRLSYLDFAIQGVGQITRNVSGPITIPATDEGTSVSQSASTTLGGLFTIRYSPRPYIGAEFNAGYARYTENYSVPPYQIQTQANELTVGYLVTPPYNIFGVKPYASAGVGAIRFAPTAGGGQGAPSQARAAYYYNLGVQKDVLSHFGLRIGFRQAFFIAPDYYQNYLTINKHTSTAEPLIGFYLHL